MIMIMVITIPNIIRIRITFTATLSTVEKNNDKLPLQVYNTFNDIYNISYQNNATIATMIITMLITMIKKMVVVTVMIMKMTAMGLSCL